MKLSPPRKGTWSLALILGLVAIVSHYVFTIPLLDKFEFTLLTAAFALLVLGVAFKNI